MIKKKEIEDLFTEYFKRENNIINKNLSFTSKYEKIQIKIFQKGIDDGLINSKIIINIIEEQELFKIFEEILKRKPNKKEISCIISILENIKRIYQEGFNQGFEIKNILMQFDKKVDT